MEGGRNPVMRRDTTSTGSLPDDPLAQVQTALRPIANALSKIQGFHQAV
jgi:hypothetical protein